VGRLIPAGTGAIMTRVREVATHRDDLIVAQRNEPQADNLALEDQRSVPAAE